MQIKFSKTPSNNIFMKMSGVIFITLIFVITSTAFLSFFSSVSTIIEIKGAWLYLYIVVVVVLLTSTMISTICNKDLIIEGSLKEKLGMVLGGLLGFSIITSFSIFSGIPTVLHYLNAKKGELEVTVSSKEDRYDKRKCSPRLIIKEFTFFSSDFICPGVEAYKSISIGDKVTVIGSVSRYGVEPLQIKLPTMPSN